MIKKVMAFILCVLFIMPFNVFAYGGMKYGDALKHLRMSGVFPSVEFWNMYAGRESCEITSEKSYRGGTSLKVDINKIKQSERKNFNFATLSNVNPATYRMGMDSLYFEWYVYGMDENIFNGKMSFSSTFNYPDGSQKVIRNMVNFEPPDQDGWIKIWSLIPYSMFGDISSCCMGVFFNPESEGVADVDCFYLDEMAIRVVPNEMHIQDISAQESVDLNLVRVHGLNTIGEKNLIESKQFFDWSVVSGDGIIKNNNLIYTGYDGGDVIVRCTFFGVTEEFTVSFDKRNCLRYSDIQNNADSIISFTAYNDSNIDAELNVVFAVYNDKRLHCVQTVKKSVRSNENVFIVSSPIKIPSYISNPEIRVYACDGFNNFSVLQ